MKLKKKICGAADGIQALQEELLNVQAKLRTLGDTKLERQMSKLAKIGGIIVNVCDILRIMTEMLIIYVIACIIVILVTGKVFPFYLISPNSALSGVLRFALAIPGVSNLNPKDSLMIGHFALVILLCTILCLLHTMKNLFAEITLSGNPFTTSASKGIRRLSWILLLILFWNIPMAIMLFGITLSLSYIFDYGAYLQLKADETNDVQEEVIISFAEITEAKSGQTGKHVKRVSEYTKVLALAMGLSEEESDKLRIAAMMHDVGKLMIPVEILEKPGKLTDEEFAKMQEHTVYGAKMLEHAEGDIMRMAALVAEEHHEKWNGKGYPNKLSGDDISLEGRIVAVADVYDALTSKRSYKDEWNHQDAYDEIVRCSGTQFDPHVVDAFKDNFERIIQIQKENADR